MNQDPAVARFIIIQMVRVTGIALAVLGLVVLGGRLDWPPLAGVGLLIVGLIDAMAVPLILARKWKSPSE